MPVGRAVLSLTVPTVISQIIMVLYNMADTFFIGQCGDPDQVAAANICMALFVFLSGIANLFGIGGAALISRCLGKGEREKASGVSAFCIWAAAAAALIYGAGLYLICPLLLPALGADSGTYDFCRQYIFWTLAVGAVPTVLNSLLAHLVRAEGCSKQAGFGMMLGALLNIALDPVFILLLDFQIAGAAFATALSNTAAAAYFILFILRRKGDTVIAPDPRRFTLRGGIPAEVMATGLPSALMSLMSTLSNVTLNKLMSRYSNEAIAGVGIAKKIDMITFGVSTGIAQGVVPLIGYNYSAKNAVRMKKAIKTSFALSFFSAVVFAALLFTCAQPIVRAFIDDAATVAFGQRFQRIICLGGPFISVTLMVITVFQAVGKKVQPLALSLLRKGGLDVPVMLLLNALVGVNGIVWATPAADLGAMLVSCVLFLLWRRKEASQAG